MRAVAGYLSAAILGSVLCVSAAHAASLDLDGADGAAIASGVASSSVYTGNAAFGAVTFSAGSVENDITYVAGSGLGIDCRTHDRGDYFCNVDNAGQIDWPEVMEVSFEQPLFVTTIDLSEITARYQVKGPFTLHVEDGGSVHSEGFDIFFSSTDADASGHLTLAVNSFATSISFIPVEGTFFEDFSLAGISIDETVRAGNPIPEPSSILLMLIGGAFVMNQVRKHA